MKAYETTGRILFEEKQKFPGWLKFVVGGIMLVTLAIILMTGLRGPAEQRNDVWMAVIIAVAIEVLLIILFQYIQLEKVVTSNGLYYRWKPWQIKFRVIEKDAIERFKVRSSPPLNYGIHWLPGYGWVHNANAGEGIQLYLLNGKKIFFGAFDTDLFQKALGELVPSNSKRWTGEL